MKQLIALSQENKQNRVFQNLLENFSFYQVSLLDLCQ